MSPRVGCHVSIAGGLSNAPARAHELGCETFQMFSRPPQGGPAPKIANEVVKTFRLQLQAYSFDHCYIHAPYYTNFASDEGRTRGFSIVIAREELERGSFLGATYAVIHPGSSKDKSRKVGIAHARESVKKILEDYSGSCELLLEISAGAGNVIGDTFDEVAAIMDGVKSKKLGGVCFDTAHAFASGYDITEATFRKFDKVIGFDYLKLLHVNDSGVEIGAHKDRHEHYGDGYIGIEKLKVLGKIPALRNIDWVAETAPDKVKEDIKILKSIRDSSI